MKTFKQFFEDNDDNMWHLKVRDEPFPDSVPISDDDYREIKHLLQGKGFVEELIPMFSEQSNLEKSWMAVVLKVILSQDDFEPAINYLRDREQTGITAKQFVENGDLFDTFASVGFDKKTLSALYELRFHTQPVMGKGEILLATLLKGCQKSPKGDISVDGRIYDVKGVSARLRGQHGFGSGEAATRVWSKWLNDLNESKNLGLDVPAAGGNEYNIKIRYEGYLLNIGSELVIKNIITPQELSSIIKEGLKSVYTELQDEDMSFIDTYTSSLKAGSPNVNQFISEYKYMFVKYYLRLENLEDTGIFAFGKNGQVRFFNSQTENLIGRVIDIDLPGFGSRTGPQGQSAGIIVR
jgi:hypothetical protein